MKTFFVIFALALTACGCQKKNSEPPTVNPYEKVFYSLPETPIYQNQGKYELRIDTVNSDPQAYYHVSGKLYYLGTLLWQADSTYAISATGNDSLLFLQKGTAPIGSFDPYLFYQGIDITAKAKPNNFPKISEIRLAGNLVYLVYSDYSSFRSHTPNRYGSYNLTTGELKTD